MIGVERKSRLVGMLDQSWESLPSFWRWCVLLGLLASTCFFTVWLRWGQLPATPFYPVVLLSVFLGTERQGAVLTTLSVVTVLVLSAFLPTQAGYAQEGLDSAVLALVGMVALLAMHQRRAARHLMKAVVYESGVLRALGNYALTRLSREEIQKVIVRYLANATDANLAFVAMPDASNTLLAGYMDSNGFGRGPQPVTRVIAETFAGDVYTAGVTCVLPDITRESRFTLLENVPLRSAVATPLLLAGRPIGVLLIGSIRPDAFRLDDIKLAEVLARSIAVPLYASKGAGGGKKGARARS